MTASLSLTASDRSSPRAGESPVETLRCTSTADFLAALPLLTGFTDQNSLFIVLFQGRRGGNVLRMELPETQSPNEVGVLLDGITTLLKDTGAGAEGPAVVIATSQTFEDSVGPPWGRLVHQLKRRFHREGWKLRELAVIADDGWCGLLGSNAGARRPLSEITESEFATSARSKGSRPRPLSSIGDLPEPDLARAHTVAKFLKEFQQRQDLRGATGPADHSINLIRNTAGLADHCFGTTGPAAHASQSPRPLRKLPARQLAHFISAAQSQTPWLVLVLTALTRAEFVVSVALDSGVDRLTDIRIDDVPGAVRGTRESWSIQHLLSSLSHELPEREKLRAAVRVLEDGIAHAPREMSPPLFAFLAWAWWMLGMQSVATRAVTQSLEVQNDHELTLMVQRLIQSPPVAHLHRLRAEFDHAGAAC